MSPRFVVSFLVCFACFYFVWSFSTQKSLLPGGECARFTLFVNCRFHPCGVRAVFVVGHNRPKSRVTPGRGVRMFYFVLQKSFPPLRGVRELDVGVLRRISTRTAFPFGHRERLLLMGDRYHDCTTPALRAAKVRLPEICTVMCRDCLYRRVP